MALKAILLDFDGVIAETENHHIAAWQRTLSIMGWQVPDEVAARSADIDDRQFLAEVFQQRGIVSSKIDDWIRKKQILTVQLLRDSPRVYPGVAELVRKVEGRARLAVVSGTWRENIEVVLDTVNLSGAFDLIIGKEDVTAVKPDPEAYQIALKRLRLSPKSCVAIEDSPSGLAAARAAGIRAVAVGHRRSFGDWVGDAAYISGLDPAEGLLQHLGL
jgi:HAD superfamily hydrolase (TIGR01509 family)